MCGTEAPEPPSRLGSRGARLPVSSSRWERGRFGGGTSAGSGRASGQRSAEPGGTAGVFGAVQTLFPARGDCGTRGSARSLPPGLPAARGGLAVGGSSIRDVQAPNARAGFLCWSLAAASVAVGCALGRLLSGRGCAVWVSGSLAGGRWYFCPGLWSALPN